MRKIISVSFMVLFMVLCLCLCSCGQRKFSVTNWSECTLKVYNSHESLTLGPGETGDFIDPVHVYCRVHDGQSPEYSDDVVLNYCPMVED